MAPIVGTVQDLLFEVNETFSGPALQHRGHVDGLRPKLGHGEQVLVVTRDGKLRAISVVLTCAEQLHAGCLGINDLRD
eukprot:2731746-Pyramimonas_sp.AAC.1